MADGRWQMARSCGLVGEALQFLLDCVSHSFIFLFLRDLAISKHFGYSAECLVRSRPGAHAQFELNHRRMLAFGGALLARFRSKAHHSFMEKWGDTGSQARGGSARGSAACKRLLSSR